jgi:phosphoesterase RecJ-like protein
LNRIADQGAAIFKTASSFIITTHTHPDGDAVGSCVGLGLALRGLGKEAAVVLERPVPASYRFLPGSGQVLTAADGMTSLQGRRFACGVVLDCTSLERTGQETIPVLQSCDCLVSIDHHISNTGFGDINILDTAASATGEILHRIMDGLGIKISPDVATNLYTAIVTDTGSFRYQNTTPRCHLAAAALLDLGADHRQVQQCLYEEKKLSIIRLLEKGLSTLTLDPEGRIAWMSLTQRFYEEAGCQLEDSEDFVNYPKSIAGVEIAILFKEIGDGEIRVGFRSKNIADVNHLAGGFGGGGHQRAAGCTIKGALQDVVPLVVSASRKYLTERLVHERADKCPETAGIDLPRCR